MLAVEIEKHAIRIGERFAVSLQRTLRIPDDGRRYPLPPGLGAFPLLKVEDYRDSLPQHMLKQGGVFIPMYQREALWLGFRAAAWKPNAIKVMLGGINAITGTSEPPGTLCRLPQNYMVCPPQPWLDGINCGAESVRQFVAMPLGLGYTVEAAISHSETLGGIQVIVFAAKPGKFPDRPPEPAGPFSGKTARPQANPALGIAAGGYMRQKIYPDPHPPDVWDASNYGCIFIHIVNSELYREITGLDPPATPIDAKTYTDSGLPWFDLYDEELGDVPASEILEEVKPITGQDKDKGITTAGESITITEKQIKKLRPED